jgi:hypothetical protein
MAHQPLRRNASLAKRNASGGGGATWLLAVAVGALLAGCAAPVVPSDQELALRGYWYHDANHQGGASGQASPQAIYNATHGVWLWPPLEGNRRG